MSSKSKRKIKIPEIVIYCICGAFGVWGLTYIILGLCATFLPLNSNAPLVIADNTIRELFGLGYLGWGLIIFSIFALVAVITLLVFAKDVDKDYEKNQRRAARLSRNKVSASEEKVIDAPVEAKAE